MWVTLASAGWRGKEAKKTIKRAIKNPTEEECRSPRAAAAILTWRSAPVHLQIALIPFSVEQPLPGLQPGLHRSVRDEQDVSRAIRAAGRNHTLRCRATFTLMVSRRSQDLSKGHQQQDPVITELRPIPGRGVLCQCFYWTLIWTCIITASVAMSLNSGSLTFIYTPLILLYDRRRHKAKLRLISDNSTEALASGVGGGGSEVWSSPIMSW